MSRAPVRPSRRWMIVSGAAAAGGLAVGFALMPYSTLPRARQLAGRANQDLLRTWLRVGHDNSVTVLVPHVDFGQGSQTALAMMLAEELDADWSRVRVEEAPADAAFANGAQVRFFAMSGGVPNFLNGAVSLATRRLAQTMGIQITAGSTAVRVTGLALMAPAGAAARWMLRRAAAKAWSAPLEEIRAEKSILSHPGTGRSATYGQMAAAAALLDPPDDLPLKETSAYRIVGKTTPRLDLPCKVDGSAIYPIDVRLPGMLFAAVRQAPVIGGKLRHVDAAPALARGGVRKVVKGEEALIVVADNTWRARSAADALDPTWDAGSNANLSSTSVLAAMERRVQSGPFDVDHKSGDAERVLKDASRKLEAVYRIPYLAHAPMAPQAAAAQWKDRVLTIWCASQNPLGARRDAAKRAGVSEDKVVFNNLRMGGGFGRGAFSDYIMHAVDAAKATDGAPVLVSWSREEDMTHDFYRQASVAKLEGAIDDQGRVIALRNSYCDQRDGADVSVLQYNVPDVMIRHANGLNPLRWGYWRSVDNTLHAFFIESFMDELAHEAGQDPLAFRRAHSGPRAQAVLDRVAEMSQWGNALAPGRAHGLALRESFGTVVAQVAEVSIDAKGQARVHSIYSAVDPGFAINPGNLVAQVEGGAIYGLSAALYGEISVEAGEVRERNFPDYNVVRMADAPRHEVSIINSNARLGGVGEVGTPGVAPAACNAIFALTGARVRELPLRHFDLRTGRRRAQS